MSETQQYFHEFFSAALSAGAILTGFCGTFLSFRVQREANYHSQPVVDFATGTGRDVFVGLSRFSSGFLTLIIATLVTIVFGLVLPLLSLADIARAAITAKMVSGGLLAGVTLICGYFWIELLHYKILTNRLVMGRQRYSVIVSILIAAGIYFVITHTN